MTNNTSLIPYSSPLLPVNNVSSISPLDNAGIIAKTIDYLKIKLLDYSNIYEILLDKCSIEYNFQNLYAINFGDSCFYNPFGDFYILNMGKIGTSKHRFDIFTHDKIKVGNIIIPLVIYKSNIAYLELSGMYFKIYSNGNLDYLERYKHLYDFFDLLNIDATEQKILKKIDFNVDILGIEVFELIEYIKDKESFKGYEVKDLTGLDKVKLDRGEGVFKHGKTTTAHTNIGTYHKVLIYDKILDVLKKHTKTKVNGINPFSEYLNSNNPITRIELTKKGESFLHMQDNSILWVFNNIESLFFDFMNRIFTFPITKFSDVEIDSLNGKKSFLAKTQREKNLLHSMIMFKAYGNNIIDLMGEDEFKEIIHHNFGDILNGGKMSIEEIKRLI